MFQATPFVTYPVRYAKDTKLEFHVPQQARRTPSQVLERGDLEEQGQALFLENGWFLQATLGDTRAQRFGGG